MSNFDDYISFDDKPFAENINDALLLSNVFDLTVPIQVPTMFRNSSWVDVTSSRKCGVAILTLKESLPSGVSISTVDGKSVLTGTGTVKLGFYPNFNSFGSFKSIDWEETGTVQINLKTVNNTTIASNISKGLIQNPQPALMTLQEIVFEIVLNNSTLKSLDVVMENKQQTRYGATVGISDVTDLNSTITSIQSKDTQQDTRLNNIEAKDNQQDYTLSHIGDWEVLGTESSQSQDFQIAVGIGIINHGFLEVNRTLGLAHLSFDYTRTFERGNQNIGVFVSETYKPDRKIFQVGNRNGLITIASTMKGDNQMTFSAYNSSSGDETTTIYFDAVYKY